MSKRREFISLFSGAGGLDLGFELAGWDCLYASDIDPCSVQTLEANRGKALGAHPAMAGTHIEVADVTRLQGAEILRKIGRKRGEVELLVGGPPCQSWSSAGHQRGFEDPRGQLFRDYVRIANETGVKWLVFENVRGLLTARGPDGRPGSALQHIRRALLEAGFQTAVELLNAADYGVPQRRVRMFIIGFRTGLAPEFPTKTHAKVVDLAEPGLLPWVSLGRCLAALPPLAPEDLIRPNEALRLQLELIEPGSGVKSPGKAEATRPGGHWGYKQGAFVADLRLPARTVTASAQQDWVKDQIHGLRRLSPSECAAIQTFPPNWTFAGKRADQYRQIGNAVPPTLAKAVALALQHHLERGVPARSERASVNGALLPLKNHLVSAIDYTAKEESRNGASRRAAPAKRRQKPQFEMES